MKMPRTVRDGLVAFGADHGIDQETLMEAQVHDRFHGLSDRYHALAVGVWLRLPDGWDSHAVWSIKAGAIESPLDEHHYAGSRLLREAARHRRQDEQRDMAEVEASGCQIWEIVLCEAAMQSLSEAAVRGVIAHEFGHVASALPTDPAIQNDDLCENRADQIARWWGFEDDLLALPVIR